MRRTQRPPFAGSERPASVSSDEDDSGAADSQGGWDHAFCAVCDCLIESDGEDAPDEHTHDDEVWEAAAMSSLRRHTSARRPRRSPGPHPRSNASMPLFCSERCRQLDQQRSHRGLSEFMNYVSDAPVRTCAASLGALRVSSSSLSSSPSLQPWRPPQPPQPPQPPELPAQTLPATRMSPRALKHAMLSRSLATSLSRAEYHARCEDRDSEAPAAAAAAAAAAADDDEDADGDEDVDDLFVYRRFSANARAQRAAAPSNLARSRMAHRVSRIESSTSLAQTPPQSLMLEAAASPTDAKSPPRGGHAFSPLDLLATGTGHHAGPSLSFARDDVEPAHASEVAHSATDSLRRAQQRAQHTGVSAPGPSEPRQRPTASATRAREMRQLPPLLAPPPRGGGGGGGGSSSGGSSGGSAGHAPPTKTKTKRNSSLSRSPFLSSSVHSTSPRRPGLGWSALPQQRTQSPKSTASMSQSLRMERVPSLLSSSSSGYVRTWSEEVAATDTPMYPILQLPQGGRIHDTYSQYWPPPQGGGGGDSGGGGDAPAAPSHRRKSLFHFGG